MNLFHGTAVKPANEPGLLRSPDNTNCCCSCILSDSSKMKIEMNRSTNETLFCFDFPNVTVVFVFSVSNIQRCRRLWCRKVAQGAVSKAKKKGGGAEICITFPCTIRFKFLSFSTTYTKLNCKIFLAIQTTADCERQLLTFRISLQSIDARSGLCHGAERRRSPYGTPLSPAPTDRLHPRRYGAFRLSACENSRFQQITN